MACHTFEQDVIALAQALPQRRSLCPFTRCHPVFDNHSSCACALDYAHFDTIKSSSAMPKR
jgi:hypothetical protein